MNQIPSCSCGTFSVGVKNYFTGSLKLFIYVKGFSVHNCILQGILDCDSLLSCGEPICYIDCSCSQCVCVCVVQDCKIHLLFQSPLLLNILTQCDNLIFRHFLSTPCLLLCRSSCLQTSAATQAFFLSFPPIPLSSSC